MLTSAVWYTEESNPLKEPLSIKSFMTFTRCIHSGTVWLDITKSFVQAGFDLTRADRLGAGTGVAAVIVGVG
jgi:hypothetical protein